MANKTEKNLLSKRDQYNRYYGDFRGVDFSSDHTQVADQRLAYAVNMYRDYQAEQGRAIETVPGFRRRADLTGYDSSEGADNTIYGIHTIGDKVFVHCGQCLHEWGSFPTDANIGKYVTVRLPKEKQITENGVKTFYLSIDDGDIPLNIVLDVCDVRMDKLEWSHMDGYTGIYVYSSNLSEGDSIIVYGYESEIITPMPSLSGMNCRRSTSVIFNDNLYIVDGKGIVRAGQYSPSLIGESEAYIPITSGSRSPSGGMPDKGVAEAHNMLTSSFKNTFVADGTSQEYHLSQDKIDSVDSVEVYGNVISKDAYDVEKETGVIIFKEGHVPTKPEENKFPTDYPGVVVTAKKDFDFRKNIDKCTLIAVFEDRIFLSGNPDTPNTLYWSALNEPTYFPADNHMQDGVDEDAPITGLLPVANTLMVLKGDTKQDGSVYYHTKELTGDDGYAATFPYTKGLNGIGCLGACVNFLDDPVFVSRLGVEAVGQLSTRLERAIEHRSSLIDAKLCNLDLSKAQLEEWNGYLVLLVEGKIFLADSRQRYTHDTGVMQYEWYYLEDIGLYERHKPEYKFASSIPAELSDVTLDNGKTLSLATSVKVSEYSEAEDLTGQICQYEVSESWYGDNGDKKVCYVEKDGAALLVYPTGAMVGKGEFYPAVYIKTIGDNLFFGTANGIVCSFNHDKRDEHGDIPSQWYSFDGRTIRCGCATKMDSCGIPHLTKNTVKKSTVIKTKSFQASAAKLKVRTNRKPYEQIARINNTLLSFDNMDFDDFSFSLDEQSLFAVKEKEKKWLEKQYYLYSDEYCKPFALYYIAFRYVVAGRYKE